MTKKKTNHTVELASETYELLQQVKKAFVSYTGEDIEQRSDAKVIDVLTGGFFDSMVRGTDGCCDGECGCDDTDDHNQDAHHHDKKDGCCGGHCKC